MPNLIIFNLLGVYPLWKRLRESYFSTKLLSHGWLSRTITSWPIVCGDDNYIYMGINKCPDFPHTWHVFESLPLPWDRSLSGRGISLCLWMRSTSIGGPIWATSCCLRALTISQIKGSHCKEFSQPRDLTKIITAKRSHSKEIEISQLRDLTAKKSHSNGCK